MKILQISTMFTLRLKIHVIKYKTSLEYKKNIDSQDKLNARSIRLFSTWI